MIWITKNKNPCVIARAFLFQLKMFLLFVNLQKIEIQFSYCS